MGVKRKLAEAVSRSGAGAEHADSPTRRWSRPDLLRIHPRRTACLKWESRSACPRPGAMAAVTIYHDARVTAGLTRCKLTIRWLGPSGGSARAGPGCLAVNAEHPTRLSGPMAAHLPRYEYYSDLYNIKHSPETRISISTTAWGIFLFCQPAPLNVGGTGGQVSLLCIIPHP